MNNNKIILLDSHAILHRFYHALPRLESPDGVPTQAVYGLSNILLKIIDEYNPQKIFACFDRPEATHRHKLYQEYKGTRPETKDDLKIQIELAKKIFEKFNIPVFEKAGYEAEDLIASIIEKIKKETESQIIIVTGDLDTLQLVEDDKIVVCILKKGFSETFLYNEEEVLNRFGFKPELLPDYKSLVGDQSDNIKGISGIGEKRGSDLIKRFGTTENIIKNAEFIKEEKVKNGILENQEALILNKHLTTINRDVEVEVPEVNYCGIDKDKLLPILMELNFKSIAQRVQNRVAGNRILELGIDIKETEKIETDVKKFENSLIKNVRNIAFIILGKDLYVKLDTFYKLEANAEILEKILNTSAVKITFDFKESLKLIFSKNINNLLFSTFNFNENKIFDTKIAFSLVYPNSTAVNINKLTGFYTGKIYSENKVILDFLDKSETIFENLNEKIKFFNVNKIYEIENKLIPVLARMELNGIQMDSDEIENFKTFLSYKLKSIEREIMNLTNLEFNINSPKILREILFEKLKISAKMIRKTPKGEISTSESELLKIQNAHPVVKKILEYRGLNKIITTYTDSLKDLIDKKTNRLHTHFEQIGAATGRITSQNPNLQNIPVKGGLAGELRKCFKPSEGFSFIGLDYSQIELRLAAHLSGDENLTLAFLGNIDVHSLTARLLFKNENEKTRRFAKTINFGIIYGISAQGLKERLGIPRSEAQKIISDYFEKFSGLKQMREEFIEKAKINGYAETMLGRKRFIPEINSGSFREKAASERAAINMPIQGLGADIIKKALINIDEFLIEKIFYPNKAKIVLQIYDSIVMEVKDDILKEVERESKKIMENIIQLKVPLIVNVKIGKNLSKI